MSSRQRQYLLVFLVLCYDCTQGDIFLRLSKPPTALVRVPRRIVRTSSQNVARGLDGLLFCVQCEVATAEVEPVQDTWLPRSTPGFILELSVEAMSSNHPLDVRLRVPCRLEPTQALQGYF